MDINYETNLNSEPFPPFPRLQCSRSGLTALQTEHCKWGEGDLFILISGADLTWICLKHYCPWLSLKKNFCTEFTYANFHFKIWKTSNVGPPSLFGSMPFQNYTIWLFSIFHNHPILLNSNHYFTLLENQIKCQPCAHCFARLVLQSPL